MMTEEQIKQMADEYASEYIPMYQKVVKIAFIDGMMKGFEQSREAIEQCSQQ